MGRAARPPAALLHRQGRRRQEHGHRGHRAARRRPGQAGPAGRGRRQEQPHRAVRARAGGVRAPAGAPRRVRHADGHRGVAARVPQGAGAGAGVRSHRSHGAGVRLRRHRRARRQGDPHRRQDLLGAARVARGPRRLGPHRGRRRRHRSRDQPARRARAIQELVAVGPIRNQTGWMVELLSDPGAHRAQRGHVAGGDAGERDHRAGRRAPAGARRAARRRDREPGAPRAVHPRRRRRVRGAPRARPPPRCCRSTPARAPTAVLDAARARGVDAPQPVGAPGRPARAVDLPLLLLPYLFVRDHGLRVTRMVAEALGQELA